jgi:hypothetical protein
VFVSKMDTAAGPHLRQRAVNRRVQGDLGEFSAMEWLASRGALVWIPLGHSPDVDLMAELDDRLLRIQVKTSTLKALRARMACGGRLRSRRAEATEVGAGPPRRSDPTKVDFLFVVVGDGRRWFLPANAIEGARSLRLGGRKYSEFEIEPGTPYEALIYGKRNSIRIASISLGECQSGQMDSTVNRAATPTEVRILSPPSPSRHALLRPKRQITIPKAPCEEAGLLPGTRMKVRADGAGRVVIERIEERTVAPGSSGCEN